MTNTTPTDGLLIQDSIGRVRTPRWRQEKLLEEYERSGMSGAAFAEHFGIKYTTLASWIQKKRKRVIGGPKALEGKSPVQWVEAVMASPQHEEKPPSLLVRMGGGAQMEIGDEKGAKLAATLLRHLGEVRAC